MSLEELIVQEIKDLSADKKAEVINFIGYLKSKERKENEAIITRVLQENAEAFTELAK